MIYALEDLRLGRPGSKTSTSIQGRGPYCRKATRGGLPAWRRPGPGAERRAGDADANQADLRALQLELFRALPGRPARRATRKTSWRILSSRSGKSRRLSPSTSRPDPSASVEAVPEHGMATIWDADVLIWAASQIVEARCRPEARRATMAATPYRSFPSSGAVSAFATMSG